MSVESERLIHHNAPTPDQLRSLSSLGVRSAVQRERFRSLSRVSGSHYFIDEMDLLGDASDDEPTSLRHRLAMRVGVRAAEEGVPKTWSLNVFDTYSVDTRAGSRLAESSIYRFEWTKHRTLMANKAFKLIGFGREAPVELDQYLDILSFSDDAVAILVAAEQLRMVTESDCEALTTDISSYLRVLDTVADR